MAGLKVLEEAKALSVGWTSVTETMHLVNLELGDARFDLTGERRNFLRTFEQILERI